MLLHAYDEMFIQQKNIVKRDVHMRSCNSEMAYCREYSASIFHRDMH